MVLLRTNDSAVEGYSPRARLRFLYVDVSQTLRSLTRSHGYGMAQSETLGKALCGLAMVSIDHIAEDTLLCVSADMSGPAGGFSVEMDDRGHLRGHVFDCGHAVPSANPINNREAYYGDQATVKFVKLGKDSVPKAQMSLQTSPASPEKIFLEILGNSVPTRVSMACRTYNNEIEVFRALAVQPTNRTDTQVFDRVAAFFADDTISEQLCYDATLSSFRDVLGLPDLETGPTRALGLGCSCSEAAVLAAYSGEHKEVLERWIRTDSVPSFRCHLCGKVYKITPEQVVDILHKR